MASTLFNRAAANGALLGNISGPLGGDVFSDLTVLSEDKEWKCHKLIVCNQSEWFMKACTGGFVEAGSKTIRLEEDDCDAIHALLEYCYKVDYGVSDSYKNTPIVFHSMVYIAADKYIIPGLQELALFRIKEMQTIDYDGDLALAAALVYENTTNSSPLRKAILSIIIEHSSDLLLPDSTHTDFTKVFNETTPLAADLARFMALSLQQARQVIELTQSAVARVRMQRQYKCPARSAGCGTFTAAIAPEESYTHECSNGLRYTRSAQMWADQQSA